MVSRCFSATNFLTLMAVKTSYPKSNKAKLRVFSLGSMINVFRAVLLL